MLNLFNVEFCRTSTTKMHILSVPMRDLTQRMGSLQAASTWADCSHDPLQLCQMSFHMWHAHVERLGHCLHFSYEEALGINVEGELYMLIAVILKSMPLRQDTQVPSRWLLQINHSETHTLWIDGRASVPFDTLMCYRLWHQMHTVEQPTEEAGESGISIQNPGSSYGICC